MPSQRSRRPVRAVPDEQPKRPNNSNPYYDMQQRVVLGGETMHLTTCGTCCAVVPSGSKAQQRHTEWHRLLQAAIDSALPR
jgi:hypothetical protein